MSPAGSTTSSPGTSPTSTQKWPAGNTGTSRPQTATQCYFGGLSSLSNNLRLVLPEQSPPPDYTSPTEEYSLLPDDRPGDDSWLPTDQPERLLPENAGQLLPGCGSPLRERARHLATNGAAKHPSPPLRLPLYQEPQDLASPLDPLASPLARNLDCLLDSLKENHTDLFPEPPTPELTGQSNGYLSQDWDCSTSSSCSSLPTPATPPLPHPPSTRHPPIDPYSHPPSNSRMQWAFSSRQAMDRAQNKVATSNVLVEKMKKSEREVIQDWLENIFKTWEKTNELEIQVFKFSPLRKEEVLLVTNGGPSITGNGAARAGVSNGGHLAGPGLDRGTGDPLAILKSAEIRAVVKGELREYSVIIKVLPTDDSERYRVKHKFRQLLKFSKEVQVYMKIIKCMHIFDEKRYTSACVEPPVPKLYFAQLDSLNDCLVVEDLSQDGFVKFSSKFHGQRTLSDLDHCRVVLRSLAHFHAYSTVIQRDSEEPLIELWPFAVEATNFKETFRDRVAIVKQQICQYLMWRNSRADNKISDEVEEKVENCLQELFWKLVELRVAPSNERITVLIHGAADLNNIMFSYDQLSGRPNQAKFLDFSKVAVSSPVVDVSYFLYSSVNPHLISEHYVTLLQAYHQAHLEAIKGFGMHGYEIDFEILVQEYQDRIDYGVMSSCLVKTALYVVQQTSPRVRLADQIRDMEADGSVKKGEDCMKGDLRIDSTTLPLDLRLCSHLATLSRCCPCPCAFTAQQSVARDIVTDSREDLTNSVAAAVHGRSKFRGLDCNRGTKSAMKRILMNLMHSDKKVEDGNSKPESSPEKELKKITVIGKNL